MLTDNRTQRRARERAEARKSRRLQKAVVALGASLVVGAGGAGAAFAESLDSQQIAENSYSTAENLIAIADNLGRTQIALLAPAGKALPDGWVPVVTSDRTTSSRQLSFIDALTEGGKLLLAVPDTSSIPGASTTLSGVSPQAAQALAALPVLDTVGSGAQVYVKMGSALVKLNAINLQTVLKNGVADVTQGLGGDKVSQHAGDLKGIPTIDDALGFWTGTQTTSQWTGTVNYLGAKSNSWISQDRVTMNGIDSDQLKALFAQNLNTPDALIVANGQKQLVQTGTKKVCTIFGCVTVPVYDTQWVGETDSNGNQVYTTTYNPNDAIAGALSSLDGIDVAGFSVISRQVGSTFTGPKGGTAAWQGAATQVIVPGVDGADDYVATVPLFAAGVALPDDLFTTGMQLTPGLVTASGQSVNTVLGSRSATASLPMLELSAERTSLLESSHLGPDGIAYNSGWTIAMIKVGDTTVPLVYSRGSFNAGPNGFGFTGPSFLGVGLPGFQVGTGPNTSSTLPDAVSGLLGDIPTSVITLTPSLLFQLAQIEDPSGGVLSDPIGTLEKVLTPLFSKYVTPTATQISQAIADATTKAVNDVSDGAKALSDEAVDASDSLADTAEQAAVDIESVGTQTPSAYGAETESVDTADTSRGRHALPEGSAPQFAPKSPTLPRHAAPPSNSKKSEDATPGSDDSPEPNTTTAGSHSGPTLGGTKDSGSKASEASDSNDSTTTSDSTDSTDTSSDTSSSPSSPSES
ncbi:hypothetical protein ACWDTD_06395 [Gordonia sp. NPDC003425]